MEIYVFEKNMTMVGMTDKMNSLIWTRSYWTPGEFKLLLPYTKKHADIFRERRLVMRKGGREAAEIRYARISKNIQGQEEIEVQGRFLPNWLSKRIVLKQINTSATTQAILYRLVRENISDLALAIRRIPNLSVLVGADLGSGVVQYTSPPTNDADLLDAVTSAAQAAKLGYWIHTDPKTGAHSFRVYKGIDRTYGNTAGNPPIIFSQEFDNILEQEYIVSIENARSTAYVGGEEKEGAPRTIVEVGGTATGLERDEIFISASDITQTYKDANNAEITMTNAQYQNALKQRGNEELEHHKESVAFSSKVNPKANVVYGVDYDLGDRVTCIDRRWGIMIDVRITEITETMEIGRQELTVTFGESLPTLTDKLRKVK